MYRISTFYFRLGTRKTTGRYHVGWIHSSHVESSRSLLCGENGRYGNLHLCYVFSNCTDIHIYEIRAFIVDFIVVLSLLNKPQIGLKQNFVSRGISKYRKDFWYISVLYREFARLLDFHELDKLATRF